jgi:threonine-phosphate decarboxylase
VTGSFPDKVVHGGKIKQIREDTGRAVIDFSANMNPFAPRICVDLSPELLAAYPDDRYMVLKEAIAARFRRPVEDIAVGNGSIELIRVFCLATLSPGMHVRTMHPTFGEYELSARLAGALPAFLHEQAQVLFICNPNNPTGVLLPRDEILAMRETWRGKHLFVDEAFIELADPEQSVADVRDPAIFVLRSLTKSFTVPGIRFGYAFGDPELVRKVETIRPPWSVNVFAEQYALAAFRSYDLLEASRKKITAEREWLVRELSRFDLVIHPSAANFLLLTFPYDVGLLCTRLLDRDILVRDCHSFGLPDSIRIAVRTRNENRTLIEVLEQCLH